MNMKMLVWDILCIKKDQKPNDLRDHRGFFKMGISQKNQQGLL